MNYYIVINGQKEGPVDVLSLIKKVKNGSVNATTQVSTTEEGPYRPAGEVDELKAILKPEVSNAAYRPATPNGEDVDVKVNILFNEGTDTWLRRIIEYTIFFGVIMCIGFFIPGVLRNIPFFQDYGYVTNYITSVLSLTIFGFFCYYVLMTKRSQDPNLKEILSVTKTALPSYLVFYAALSLLTLPLGLNIVLSIITLIVIIAAFSATCFVPFLIGDHRMGLARSVKVSVESFKTMKKPLLIVVVGIFTCIIAAGFFPVLIHSQILLLGLVAIVPISVSILAHIYDRLLA